MHPIIEKHGKQLMSELLDIIFIHEGKIDRNTSLKLLKKHNVISKGGKYASCYYHSADIQHEYRFVNGRQVRHTLERPYKQHRLYFKNGNGAYVLDLIIKDIDIPQIMEDLRNETNQTI